MRPRQPAMPWAARWGAYSTPGSLILKTAPGWELEAIPTYLDVRAGVNKATTAVDRGGAVDRVLRHYTGTLQVARVHTSARSGGAPGRGNRGFDETEHALGLSRTFQVDVDDACDIAGLVDALRSLDAVAAAYPHFMSAVPFEAGVLPETAWAARELIRAVEAQAYESGDPAVIVGVIDTGAALEHPELVGCLRRGCDTVQLIAGDLPAGVTLLSDAALPDEPVDGVGHGTSCAGIIAGAGFDIPPGLAGRCSVLPVRVLGTALFPGRTAPTGIGAIADIDCGVKRAVDLGAKVLNMSFGTPQAALGPDDPAPHADVVKYALARGCVLVAASGNSGRTEAFSPANLPGVIAVGACDDDARPAPFSTGGAHVDVAAPGVAVLSAGLAGPSAVTGTSFAAPFVAAAAALLVARAAARAHPLDGFDVHRLLTATARPWGPGVPPNTHGVGVLDARAALAALDREIDETPTASREHR